MISRMKVFKYPKLLKHDGLTPQQLWTKNMTMWPDKILFRFVLYYKMSISFCGKAFVFLLN